MTIQCPHEPQLPSLSDEEIASTFWAAHIPVCPVCRETRLVCQALRAEAEILADRATLPPSAALLLTRRIMTIQAAERRIARPLTSIENLLGCVLPIALLGLILTNTPLQSSRSIVIAALACITFVVLGLRMLADRFLRLS